jgi:hypothetical protein
MDEQRLWQFGEGANTALVVVKDRRIGLLRMLNGSDANGKSAAYLT